MFGLLLVLIAVGVSQAFPRQATLRRVTVLPLAMLAMSLQGVVTGFGGHPLGLVAWMSGVAAALVALHGHFDVSAVHYAPGTRRFQLPGSWLPLALMLGIFAVKFTVGVLLAMHPAWGSSAGLALTASTAYGLFSGVFLARAMALWAVARGASQPSVFA